MNRGSVHHVSTRLSTETGLASPWALEALSKVEEDLSEQVDQQKRPTKKEVGKKAKRANEDVFHNFGEERGDRKCES